MTVDAPAPLTTPSPWRWPLLATLFAVAAFGAWQLAFLCDDAFITFRYVANAHEGHGLTWNRAPFAPVDGYTGLSWSLVLWAAWSWFGVEPPASVNWISLGFGALQFVLLAAVALRLRARDGSRAGDAVALTTLAVIVGNRSFLQWTTGGLDTPLFNLVFIAWVLLAFARGNGTPSWWFGWSLAGALAAHTRPDGLLLVAATMGCLLLAALRRQATRGALLAALLPFATVVAHVLWRRWYYGEWLPNTYYAKVVDPWPEAGLRYLACHAVEHGTWFVAGVAAVWFLVEHVRCPAFVPRVLRDRTVACAAVATCFAHAGYYVLRVGGDHFEYRVLSQWGPLLALATALMGLRLAQRPRVALLLLAGLGLAGSVGWLHFALTRDMPAHGFRRIAPDAPSLLRPLARWYDRQQAWLLFQNVGVRCRQHANLLHVFLAPFPGRLRISDPPDPFPVFTARGIGVVGWSLPDCAVIDQHGLNDWVVARTPVHGAGPALTPEFLQPFIDAADADKDGWFTASEIRAALAMLAGGAGADSEPADYLSSILLAVFAEDRLDAMTRAEAGRISELLLHARAMAHERHPPPGYVEAFEPNVVVVDGKAIAKPRATPMTAERIRAIEAEWRARARAGTLLR